MKCVKEEGLMQVCNSLVLLMFMIICFLIKIVHQSVKTDPIEPN